MSKRPVMFTDWRRLYHQEGFHTALCVLRNFDGHQIKMDRHLWKSLHRLRRIEDRIHLESEVKDASWYRALLKVLWRE